MMSEPLRLPIRVFSDLHLGNRASLVVSPESVAPLFEGVGTVILNGDTFDLRHPKQGEADPAPDCPFEPIAARAGCRLVKVAGNHDPDCSPVHHLDLLEGRVLLTHGDVLYPEIAPWSRFAEQFRQMIARELEELQNPAGHSLEHLLQTNKKVARQILDQPHFYFPTNESFARHLLRYLWPPTRILRILGSWRRLPGSASDLAVNHRPAARFIILGHTHFPGIWKRGNRVIINTGSFLPWLGRLCVEFHSDRLEVRRIRHRNGLFRPGKVVRSWSLASGDAHGG